MGTNPWTGKTVTNGSAIKNGNNTVSNASTKCQNAPNERRRRRQHTRKEHKQ